VKAARWSPDGGLLATAAYDKRIRVFESGSFRLVAELVDPIMWNRSLAWTGDGRLATGSFRRTPVVWRPGDPTARHLDRLGSAGINGMALSPRGDFVALACDDGGSRLVDTASGRILRERFDHDGAVLCAAVSPDGRRIAFGGWDDRVTLYEVGSGAPRAVAEGCGEPVNALTFTADGRHVAIGSFMGRLLLLDAASGRRVAEPGRHRGSVKSVAALPDGSLLSGGRDGRLRRFGVEGPGDVIEVGDTIVNGVAASPDGRRVACASRGCGVEVYDLATGTRRASFREHPVSARAVDVSPDGRVVAAGYYDGHVLLWRPDEGRHRLLRPFGGTAVSAVRFAPDGHRLWVSTWDPRGRFGVVDVEAAPEVHDACVTGRFE
jgi:WD40 repeat protein